MKVYKIEDYIKDGLSLGIFKSTGSTPYGEHTHEFTEIIYVLDGEVVERINDTEYRLTRGDLLFINYGSTHSFSPIGNVSFLNISFSPEVMGRRIISRENAFDLLSLTAFDEIANGKGEGVVRFSGEERRTIEAVLLDMLNEYSESFPEREAVLESYMTVVISKILRKMHPTIVKGEESDKVWRELFEYIGENLDKKLTLSELSKKCFYNPSYFSRTFKEKFGITLADYLQSERAEAAARLLKETDLPTQTVAEKCGFSDKSSLYRAFVKIYGVTPSEYRKK